MKVVDIVYNPYRISTSISIDGRVASINGVLANYQTIELVNWGMRFFEDVRISANDSYRIIFHAPAPECRCIERLAQDSACSGIVLCEPEILNDTTMERLEALSKIVSIARSSIKVPVAFDVYSDHPEDSVYELFSPLMPQLGFAAWEMKVKPLASFDANSDFPYFIICSDKRKTARMRIAETETNGCMLTVSDNASFQYKGCCFVESVRDSEELGSRLKDYMDILVWEKLLRDGLSQITLPQEDENSDVLFLLDKIEPTPFIRLPATIELGVDYQITINMLPTGAPPCECTVQTSDARIIVIDSMKLSALMIGKAMIRVYSKNDPTPIASRYVQVEKRNRIQSLDFDMPAAIRIGDIYDIDVSYEPKNADNADEIVFWASDKHIVDTNKAGVIRGVDAGVATITARAGKVTKEKQIKVVPCLKKLIWYTASKEVLENTAVSVKLTREPRNATLDKVVISVYPPSGGVYDERAGLLQVNHPGFITLSAQTVDGKVSESVYLEAKERKQAKRIPRWLIITLTLLGLWILAQIFPFTNSVY